MAKRSKKPAPAEAADPPKPAKPAKHIKLPCHFKSVNLPDGDSATIGIRILRANLPLGTADNLLCSSQLAVDLSLEDGEQQHLKGMEPTPLEAVAEVKGYSVTAKAINCTLRLHAGGVDPAALARYASKDGSIAMTRTGSIAVKPGSDSDGEEADDDGGATPNIFEGDQDKDDDFYDPKAPRNADIAGRVG